MELAPRVRVNAVSPGWVRTPIAEDGLREVGAAIAAVLPNRRLGEVEDVVHAVLYLASEASGRVLGEGLCVSGGALLIGRSVPALPAAGTARKARISTLASVFMPCRRAGACPIQGKPCAWASLLVTVHGSKCLWHSDAEEGRPASSTPSGSIAFGEYSVLLVPQQKHSS
jgi:hypothetical protein